MAEKLPIAKKKRDEKNPPVEAAFATFFLLALVCRGSRDKNVRRREREK